MAIVLPAAPSLLTTSIKTEELSSFFKQFTQTLARTMGSQGNKSKLSGYNAQLLCVFCGNPGHFIGGCLVCQSYIADGKCKRKGYVAEWSILSL
jgi:hypothetical protein